MQTRQSEVLELAMRGRSADEIAGALTLSRRTVEKHFEAIYAKLGVKTRAQAVAAAASAPWRARRVASPRNANNACEPAAPGGLPCVVGEYRQQRM